MADGTNVDTARKAPVTHKDVTIAYFLEGIGKVGEMLAGHTNPVAVLDKCVEVLTAKGENTEELGLLRETFARGMEPGVRGRKPAKVGDKRLFSVQQITNAQGEKGDVFIRLPLSTLGVLKGQKVAARFMDGEIVLTLLDMADGAVDSE